MDYLSLKSSIYNSILDLVTDEGINASGRNEVFGCIFGRDSAITVLKLLKATTNPSFTNETWKKDIFAISKKSLLGLAALQGRQTNVESGEEPGKFIHEYRKDNYKRLLELDKPWYVYPDGIMRNYDSLDSTPLALIAIYKYWELTKDNAFLLSVLPAVESGLNWIITYGDLDKELLLEYELSPKRKSGGLVVQSWTDSRESVLNENGEFPTYPIAPVEVQGYAWLALRLWADFYAFSGLVSNTQSFSQKLLIQAENMKKRFNQAFLFENEGFLFPAQALDGAKNQLQTVTGNPLLLLWATYKREGLQESIIETKYIKNLVARSFQEDMFEEDAGIRTMSRRAKTYIGSQNSYHNGSFWPKLNGMAHEGLMNWGFYEEAERLRMASLRPIAYFGSPIELYIKKGNLYLPYQGPDGQESCRVQAWSAASCLDLLTI